MIVSPLGMFGVCNSLRVAKDGVDDACQVRMDRESGEVYAWHPHVNLHFVLARFDNSPVNIPVYPSDSEGMSPEERASTFLWSFANLEVPNLLWSSLTGRLGPQAPRVSYKTPERYATSRNLACTIRGYLFCSIDARPVGHRVSNGDGREALYLDPAKIQVFGLGIPGEKPRDRFDREDIV